MGCQQRPLQNPQLISTPEMLDEAMTELGSSSLYGFDLEFHGVVLVDVPALSATIDGVNALERHIGKMFH
jgi:hypothetical protein